MARSWLFAVLLTLALLKPVPAFAVEVVVHAAQPDSSVSRSLVRGIFGMRVRAWPDGAPVRVFVIDDAQPLHQEFCKSVLQMYPYQLRQNWDRLLYSGTGQPPVVVGSEEELLKRVAETPGAVGYVTALPITAPSNPKVKSKQPPPPAAAVNVKVLHVH